MTNVPSEAPSGVRSLSVEECWSRLEHEVVGRVGFDIGHGNRILPVNYAVDGWTVLVRTDPASELGRCVEVYCVGAVLAFEVDQVDLERHRGWSVLLQASAATVDADTEAALRSQWSPHPWAGGARPLLVRLSPVRVMGRRIGRDW